MILRTENLVKKYKKRVVVKGVSVQVAQGEIVGLLGPNGAGKTTTFYMIVGLVQPNSGKIYLDDENITDRAMYERAQLGVGYLPQEASVFRKLSVEDNLKAVLEMTKLTKKEQSMRLERLIDELGLGHVRENRGDFLSGGERRRTEIARALATDPKFILLDEPFAGVDPIAVEDIQSIVAQLKTKNIGILITDHNVQETLSITDRAYLLYEGRILKDGVAEDLASDPEVRKLYLGQHFELRRSRFSREGTRDFLQSLSPRELAYLYHYRYAGAGKETQESIDDYLRDNYLSTELLEDIVEKERGKEFPVSGHQCPRCRSFKIEIIEEPKVKTNKYEGMDAMAGNRPVMVRKTVCNVCGYVLSDPNA
jgi:lipopolysaccharide export system ATP-binding protein